MDGTGLTWHRPVLLWVPGPVVLLLWAAVVADGGVFLPPGASDVFHGTLGKVRVTPDFLVPF